MKRLAIALLYTGSIFAAGTCTTGMPIQTGTSTQYTLTVVCTADASTGSYPATAIPGLVAYPAMQGAFLISVQIQPGSPAPTAGYALTLKNAGNADQIGGQAHALSASASVIYATTATSVPISGTLTVRFTGNSVNSAVTTLTLNISTVAGGSGGGGGSGITGTGTTGTPVSWTGSSTVGDAGFADVVGLWTTCSSGYLKFDGSCSTPSGGVTSVATNNGLTGGTITTTGTIGLDTIPNNKVLCNNSGGTAVPTTANCGVTGTGNSVMATSPTMANPVVGTQSQNDNSTKAASTAYTDLAVSNAVAGVNPAVAVIAASTANVTGTYNNGTAGIGATFTVTATGAFTLDGISIGTVGQRVLLKSQSSGLQNGVYTATVVGAVAVSPIFTRALDYNSPSDINSTGAIPVQSGTVNATTSWLLTSTVTTVGTDALTYVQFSIAPGTLVTASSPGVGLCHFAGSTQACASSAVNLAGADVTGTLANANLVGTGSTTVNGQTCTLGSSCTVTSSGSTSPNGYGMWQLTVPTSGQFTWLNQGGATFQSGTNFLGILAPSTAGTSLRVAHQACPAGFGAGTSDLYVLALPGGQVAGNSFNGVEIDDGTKLVGIGINQNGGSTTISTVTWATTTTSSASVNSDTFSTQLTPGPIWYQVHNAAGNLAFRYSNSGGIGVPGTSGDWRTLTTSTSGSLAGVTNCGIFANSNGAIDGLTVLSFAFVPALVAQ